MAGGKSIPKVPDFSVDDVARLFALWLQKRCREHPGFEREIADVTFTSVETVKAWRKGQRPGMEALLRALAYGGPHAVNEVLLEPMGMAGARYVGEEAAPMVEHMFVARREVSAADADLSWHPGSKDCTTAVDQGLQLIGDTTRFVQRVTDLLRARGGTAEVVEIAERERRA